MTENQKLREALQDAATSLETISRLAGKAVHPNGDLTCMGTFADVRGYATSRAGVARQALAMPTAEQVDDINVAESFTSVTKTAEPVGDLPELPEPFALSVSVHEGDTPAKTYVECLLFQKHPNGKQKLYTADQMRAYARAALSAGDAVDPQRLDFIEKSARCDPKMDGQHVWWPTSFNTAQLLKGPTLREAIDNAIRARKDNT